jgi:hypothetical protein
MGDGWEMIFVTICEDLLTPANFCYASVAFPPVSYLIRW